MYLCTFPDPTDCHFREKAEKELGEVGGDLTYTKIRQLRQQLNIYAEHHQRGLGGRRDDSFLLRFLRAKKFDVEKAFKMVSGVRSGEGCLVQLPSGSDCL